MEAEGKMKFPEYYERWIAQLEGHLRVLVASPAQHEAELEAIVKKLTAQQKEYYKMKWAWAEEDVLALFAPEWLSPLENAYLWLTGWKPSVAFRLVDSLKVAGLTDDQLRRIEALRLKMRAEELRVEREMERHQVAMADRKMVELARRNSHSDSFAEGALKGLLAGLQKVMKMADCVRLNTLKGVLDVLTPMQCVQFLAATSMLQIQIRKWGNITNKSCN